jgi:pyruvate,water dikinase
MLRAGLPVPDGFVIPFATYRAVEREIAQRHPLHGGPAVTAELVRDHPLSPPLLAALGQALGRLGAPAVAVRSSATGEDSRQASAAGQYETVLAVHGLLAVADAVRTCWASLHSARATAYRSRAHPADVSGEGLAMAVIVQRHLDADVSGVMFTPASVDGVTTIDSAWGLGPGVVAGTVTPDTYRVEADGTITSAAADKLTRLDRIDTRLLIRDVSAEDRRRATLDEDTASQLASLGEEVAETLGSPQDIEWAIVDGTIWLVQARPITVAPPPLAPATGTRAAKSVALTGIPGSAGTATGTARTVRGPDDFARVRPGDILVCPFTDPAWTPLLGLAAGVITETGGALSHAAIVAREHGIPAVLGLAGALTSIPEGAAVTVNGTTGAVTTS